MPLGRAGVPMVGIIGMPIPVGIIGVMPGMGPRELIGTPMDMGVSNGIIVGACIEPIPATKTVTGLLNSLFRLYTHTNPNTHNNNNSNNRNNKVVLSYLNKTLTKPITQTSYVNPTSKCNMMTSQILNQIKSLPGCNYNVVNT